MATKDYSSKQEKMIADALGWHTVTGSGATPCAPGDIQNDKWLGECKTHMSDAKIYFDYAVWSKINFEAIMFRHVSPVLFTDDGSQKLNHTWCVCLSNSVESDGNIIKPLNSPIRKNISFSHLDQYAEYKKIVKEREDISNIIAFSAHWGTHDVLIMPFEEFAKVVEEQG